MRRLVSLASILLLGLSGALAGCGNNACEQANEDIAEKYAACDPDLPAPAGPQNVECTEALAAEADCKTICYEAASCDTLKGNDAGGSIALGECLDKC